VEDKIPRELIRGKLSHVAPLLVVIALILQTAPSAAAPGIQWSAELLRKPAEWYASADARAVADRVLQHQSAQGGWPKNTDLAAAPAAKPDPGTANTIDNGATTTPMRFLALMAQATHDRRYRESFERGLKYLLAAQYPNGGWPQFYPLREGYYSHITFNDDAMVNVLELLRTVSAGADPYGFVDADLRTRAAGAVSRGTEIILRTQIRQNGRLTAWCAQYDERTLAPAWARNFEPPSLSGNETVGIVRFLLGVERPSRAIVAAIDGAVAWLTSAAIRGRRVEDLTDGQGRDRRAVDDPSAEPLWARFYELDTNRPIFLGRDRVIRDDFNAIERERRVGYAYYGRWPARLLAEEYPRWRSRLR
jgi:PelA/Pel-15E family pectate lyase